ncbi:GDSL-type esterase/lipase family protein [Oerskovia jenensis]|uniref:Lysophospholipase L1-like esterase n=1 Tax=Oerskovia jenensis TaxID=162169 RepID=A0ABS2LI01_9CELL|nr:GDSL-type esterase/lipase family protein [Oerskovia jenensis]MBM7479504.1 lysophospholipase L1-like esterase [Oerskovia jenensis]
MSMPGPDVRTCFVGDSFVAGTGDPTALGWVGRVTAAAIARGHRLTAYNLGVRGDTSQDVGDRLARELAPRLPSGARTGVVLSFGVNDTVLVDGRVRVTPAGTVEAFDRSYRTAGAAEVLLVGPPAVDDDTQNARLLGTSEALREVARHRAVPFVDTFSGTVQSQVWRREVRDGDGYHPGAAGYEVLAGIVVGPFLAWLDQRSSRGSTSASATRSRPVGPARRAGRFPPVANNGCRSQTGMDRTP